MSKEDIMNKEQQIKEMQQIVLNASEEYYQTKCDKECAECEAIALYEAGYRKQADVAREFAERLYREIYNIDDTVSTVQLNNYTKDYIRKPCVVSAITEVAKEFGVEEERMKENRCSMCQAQCDVVEVTAKLTGIKKNVCPKCYLKLRDTGLIEKESASE